MLNNNITSGVCAQVHAHTNAAPTRSILLALYTKLVKPIISSVSDRRSPSDGGWVLQASDWTQLSGKFSAMKGGRCNPVQDVFTYAYKNRSRLAWGSTESKFLLKMMSKLSPADLGLRPVSERKAAITMSQTVYRDDSLSMAVFLIPKGVEMPLHDHRSMTVISSMLYGSARSVSFDWQSEEDGRAVLTREVVLRAGTSASGSILGPKNANIHSFKAIEDCAMLDVLVPAYKDEPSYFRATPVRGERGVSILKRYDADEFTCGGEPYNGPTVVVPSQQPGADKQGKRVKDVKSGDVSAATR